MDEEGYDEWEEKLFQKFKGRILDEFRKDAGEWFLRNVLHAAWRVALVIVIWEVGGKRAIEWFKLIF